MSKQVEIRGSIRYSIETKESRSIDRAENHGAERKGVLTQEVELKPRRLRTRITPKPDPNHLLKKDQFVDDLFIIYRINQNQDQLFVVR